MLRTVPRRHGCLIVGDLNTPAVSEPGVCGPAVVQQQIQQQDQAEFQDILRKHQCCILNSWSGTGNNMRTYIPPGDVDGQRGTQIDFVIARDALADDISKRAGPLLSPPVDADIVPSQPLSHCHDYRSNTQRPPVGLKPRQVQQELHDPNRTYMFQALVQPALAVTEPEDELDQVLLQGWRLSQQLAPPPTAPRQSLDLQAQHHTVRGNILLMWQQRASLRALAGTGQVEQGGRSLKTLWDAWAVTAKLQATTRQLRRECRRRKTLRILEAVNSENIHQAAKKFGPKQVRRRLQLRSTEGQIQSQEAELQQILKYFRTLFAGPIHTPVTLSQDMEFAEEELQQALGRLAAGKAMPTPSAPAALWETSGPKAAPALLRQFNHYLRAGTTTLPLRFNLSELVVIPKPGKPLRSPEQLRPINLLSLQAKTLGAMIAARLQPYAADFLQKIPQYAYLGGRSLGMALERVAGHCSMVRRLLKDQPQTLHARRAGRRAAKVCGGVPLSLDVVQSLRQGALARPGSGLERCTGSGKPHRTDHADPPTGVCPDLPQRLHGLCSNGEGTQAGMRAGANPLDNLPGWVLKGLHQPPLLDVTTGNTTYADDFHFGWTIHTGLDMERPMRP